MRTTILAVLVCALSPAIASANTKGDTKTSAKAHPTKVAVVPLTDDDDGSMEAIVEKAAASNAKVVSTKLVAKALKDLAITNPDSEKSAKRLRKKLDVDAVIYGRLEKDGAKKKLKLTVYSRTGKPEQISIDYKKATAETFHTKVKEELATKLSSTSTVAEEEDEEDVKPTPKQKDKEKGKDKQKDKDKDKPKPKHVAVEEEEPTEGEGGEEEPRVHKRGHHKADATEREPMTQSAMFASFGGSGLVRQLNYVPTGGAATPPRVGTGAFGLGFDGELYPGAFDSLASTGSKIGFYASASKAVGLSIAVPGTTQAAPINEATYAIGARYRFVFGKSSFAVGAAYWNQMYTANRSGLMAALDMPDVNYVAIAPGALLRLAASPKVGVALGADIPLLLKSGPITDPGGFGAASVISFAVKAGLDVALAPHYGLHFSAALDQVNLKFKSGDVASASDRTIDVTAAFALTY